MAAHQASEREWFDDLVEHAQRYRRKAVVNYYVALKSSRFVILTGPQGVDKMRLAQGVAQALVGPSSLQWSSFEAHPWWSTDTGHPGRFAIVHARFNAVIDLPPFVIEQVWLYLANAFDNDGGGLFVESMAENLP